VLKPPSDSLLLADQLRKEALKEDASVLDLCSGSGILAVVAAQYGARRVTAVDISRRAVLATRVNAWLNGVHVNALRGDLFDAVPGQRFDLIASNPPYLPAANEALPKRGARRAWDAGQDGRAFLDRICAQAHHHLAPGGVLLLVHSSVCGEQQTVTALSERGFEVQVTARRHGPLGPRMRARAPMLRGRGLLSNGDFEDLVVVRASRPSEA
jgi:release factor glutamine methyltransferase